MGTLPRSVQIFCLILILISAGARFINIDSNVIGWHSWRQADTAAIARNFHETGESILYPRVDWGGGDYVEAEFQLYPYAVSLLYGMFGVNEAYARLLSIIIWLLGVYGLYRLTERFYGTLVAMLTATTYAVIPLSLFYGRVVMPEPLLIASIIWGLHFFDRWMDGRKSVDWLFSCAFITLAVLLKIPTLYVGLPLLYITWTHSSNLKKLFAQPMLWVFTLVVFLAAFLWYSHANYLYQQTGNTFGIWLGSTDKWGGYSSLFTFKFYNDVFFKSIAERHLTWPGMLLFLYGLSIRRKGNREWLAEWWLLAVLVYILVVNKGNQVHEYYQLPFIPPAAIVIGRSWERLTALAGYQRLRTRRLALTGIIVFGAAILVLSGLRYSALLTVERHWDLPEFAAKAQELIPEDSRVLDISMGDPVTLYLLHRKGWIANCSARGGLSADVSHAVIHRNDTNQYHCDEIRALLQKADTLLAVGNDMLLEIR